MLNSVKHETVNAHKYKNIKNFGLLQAGSDKPRMLFFPLINFKMPTIVGWHFNIYNQKKKSCSVELSMKKVL